VSDDCRRADHRRIDREVENTEEVTLFITSSPTVFGSAGNRAGRERHAEVTPG
jgi:hypothetical protein